MSILIKGIDMPSENNSIIVEIFPSGGCSTMKVEKGECYELCLNGEAEAIQIPKGHGNIKDENEIIKRLEEKEKEPLYQHDTDDWWLNVRK